eukprot:gb/GECG01015068.1/.p1 GENE.gb/GECG01015068.1/~~gb/GECG01015068.1/.p1  ORF type:complete len:220 (+),score=20.25 gb/GECG01015068.1/:1-660(+)
MDLRQWRKFSALSVGGVTKSGEILNDLWAVSLNATGAIWQRVETSTDPKARYNAEIWKHEKCGTPGGDCDEHVYLFGGMTTGYSASGTEYRVYLEDLWRFDCQFQTWKEVDTPLRSRSKVGSDDTQLTSAPTVSEAYVLKHAEEGGIWRFTFSSETWTRLMADGIWANLGHIFSERNTLFSATSSVEHTQIGLTFLKPNGSVIEMTLRATPTVSLLSER